MTDFNTFRLKLSKWSRKNYKIAPVYCLNINFPFYHWNPIPDFKHIPPTSDEMMNNSARSLFRHGKTITKTGMINVFYSILTCLTSQKWFLWNFLREKGKFRRRGDEAGDLWLPRFLVMNGERWGNSFINGHPDLEVFRLWLSRD